MVHADETPVQVLMPGSKKTHRAYVWAYATTASADIRAVVYDFSPSRSGEHARNFLQDWKGKLVCDDFGGYKASFALGVTEIGCMAHARRELFKVYDSTKSPIAEEALRRIGELYAIEAAMNSIAQQARPKLNTHNEYLRPQLRT